MLSAYPAYGLDLFLEDINSIKVNSFIATSLSLVLSLSQIVLKGSINNVSVLGLAILFSTTNKCDILESFYSTF